MSEKMKMILAACEELMEYEKKELAVLIVASTLNPISIHNLGIDILKLAKDEDEAGMKDGYPQQLHDEGAD